MGKNRLADLSATLGAEDILEDTVGKAVQKVPLGGILLRFARRCLGLKGETERIEELTEQMTKLKQQMAEMSRQSGIALDDPDVIAERLAVNFLNALAMSHEGREFPRTVGGRIVHPSFEGVESTQPPESPWHGFNGGLIQGKTVAWVEQSKAKAEERAAGKQPAEFAFEPKGIGDPHAGRPNEPTTDPRLLRLRSQWKEPALLPPLTGRDELFEFDQPPEEIPTDWEALRGIPVNIPPPLEEFFAELREEEFMRTKKPDDTVLGERPHSYVSEHVRGLRELQDFFRYLSEREENPTMKLVLHGMEMLAGQQIAIAGILDRELVQLRERMVEALGVIFEELRSVRADLAEEHVQRAKAVANVHALLDERTHKLEVHSTAADKERAALAQRVHSAEVALQNLERRWKTEWAKFVGANSTKVREQVGTVLEQSDGHVLDEAPSGALTDTKIVSGSSTETVIMTERPVGELEQSAQKLHEHATQTQKT